MSLFEKITDKIYAHTEGKTIGNVGVIVTEIGNYLIDTSMYPKLGRDIRIEIEQLKTGKLKGVILTHYHFDHTGGAQNFHDVPLIGHKLMDENFKNKYKEEEFMKQLRNREDSDSFDGLILTPPNTIFETNPYNPEDSDQIEIWQVGGHTSGSAIIHFKTENVIFAGDDLFSESYPWGGDPTASPIDWLNALNKVIEINPDYIIPGHGPWQNAIKEVDNLKEYIEKVIENCKKLINDGVSENDGVKSLLELEYHDERRKGMKEETLKRWYEVINESSD